LLFIFGLTFGSFFNVVIHRLPLMMQQEESARFNLCVPASFCPQCQRPIIWRDNIPLLSYLSKARPLLPGAHFPALSADGTGQRTALCAGRISADAGITAAGGLILLSTLLVLAIIDGQTQLLPDRLTLPLLWAGLLFNLNGTFVPLSEAVIGAMTGYLSLWTVYWLFRLLTGKEALGYGDFKLLAARRMVRLADPAADAAVRLGQRPDLDLAATADHAPVAGSAAGLRPWLALAGSGLFLWTQTL
jgi:general secretion pathway protein O